MKNFLDCYVQTVTIHHEKCGEVYPGNIRKKNKIADKFAKTVMIMMIMITSSLSSSMMLMMIRRTLLDSVIFVVLSFSLSLSLSSHYYSYPLITSITDIIISS